MTAHVLDWLLATWGVIMATGPWLLAGLAVAGMLKQFLPEAKVYRHLGRDDLRSVSLAALVGAPLPLCSCSVLPAAVALQKAGASKSATTAFLISTPETGVDSIGTTWALMDPLMTIVRPIAALATAIVSGAAVAVLVRMGKIPAGPPRAPLPAADCGCEPAPVAKLPFARRVLEGLKYGYGGLLSDLAPWFLLGFATAGLITVLIPDNFFGGTFPNGWPALLAMLVVGAPLYVCATASTPIAAALVAKGMDPGAALVFLLAGPATNVTTMAVVKGFLGGRVLGVYLAAIAVVALAFGLAVNALYPALGLVPATRVDEQALHEHGGSPLAVAAGAVLLGLVLLHAALRLRRHDHAEPVSPA